MSADWWQNFANNFAADLAPLLSLFGEQPTKQFVSETLDLVDIVIFSIAPIGVLTAVVSAIRVGGDPSLRAFIGRAKEASAYAESELCSSTSRYVSELYTSGGIARVFGRPNILEIVYHPSKDHNPDTAGIYTFEGQQTEWEETKKGRTSERAAEKSFNEHPNLSLNVGIKKRDRLWFYLAAALGLILQGGVLIFAALETYVYPDIFKRDSSQIVVPAFPFTLIGTILLCSGVGLCATVVEGSTMERAFKRKEGSECRMHWIQPGGQAIGDQVLNSFAYSETSNNPLEEYTTSWKIDEQTLMCSEHGKKQLIKKKRLLWAAVTTACVGFVLQFLGMRSLHSSVSIAQFVVMLVMATIRALLRTPRLRRSNNLLGDSLTLYQGHELDWLSIQLTRPKDDGDGRRWTWQIIRPFEGFSYGAVDDSQKPPRSSLATDPGPGLEKAFLMRARLARLTGAQSPNYTSIAYNSWDMTMIASRKLALSLAEAIEGTMALFYSKCTIDPSWQKASKISWSIPCGRDAIGEKQRIKSSLSRKLGYITFTLSRTLGRTEGSWKADKSELEAALGLWLWSIRLNDRVQSSGEISEEIPVSSLPCSRIVLSHETTISSAANSTFSGRTSVALSEVSDFLTERPPFPAEANLKLWLGSRRLILRQTTLAFLPSRSGPSAIVEPLKEYEEATCSMIKPTPRRLFSHHLLPQPATPGANIHVLEVPSKSSLEMMCAQEIFSAFLVSLSPILHQIGGKTSIVKDSDKVHLEIQRLSDMIRNFTASGIGSEEDALTCILPILHHQGKLVHSMVFTESIEVADVYRKRNKWVSAERVLLCALDLSLQALGSYVIIQHGPGASTKYTKEQNMCLLGLFDLYRWALLGRRHSRLFGLRGILSICKTHDFNRFSNEVFHYLDAAFALCTHHQDDPTIRQLSEEFQAEVEKGTMSAGIPRKIDSYISYCRDEFFQDVLQHGDLATTLYLLKDKVFSFCRDPPAIILAASHGWGTVLKNLFELGANPEETDQNGLNYLHHASRRIADPETFLQLVGNQSYLLNRMDKRGRTPLHLAAAANHKK